MLCYLDDQLVAVLEGDLRNGNIRRLAEISYLLIHSCVHISESVHFAEVLCVNGINAVYNFPDSLTNIDACKVLANNCLSSMYGKFPYLR